MYAVNNKNVEFLNNLGAWSGIANKHVQVYKSLSLYSDTLEQIEFKASDINLDNLGYMVENAALVEGILEQCKIYDNFVLLLADQGYQITSAKLEYPGTYYVSEQRFEVNPNLEQWGVAGRAVAGGLAALHQHQLKLDFSQGQSQQRHFPVHWVINFANGQTLKTSVVLAADGANSFWRQQAKIPLDIHNYPTKCMLVEVEGDAEVMFKYQEHTWQKIEQGGPKAWLPMSDSHGVLCWYDYPQVIDNFLNLSPEQQAQELLKNFPADRVGQQLKVLKAGAFALSRNRALRYWQNNVLLFGDAAHTVSPLAGQGLNIGLQDVQLFNELLDAGYTDFDKLAYAYAHERFLDNSLMQDFLTLMHHSYISTNVLAKTFINNLGKIDNLPSLEKLALAYACGDRKLLRSYFNLKAQGIKFAEDFLADLRVKGLINQ